MPKSLLKNWWRWLKYEPEDPRFLAGGKVKIAVIGGGTGLSVMIRGLKRYSNDISAIVAMTDDGDSSGFIRKEFDILPPGDVRKCISALAYDERLISSIMEYRFADEKKNFGGHTLGNIWITALTNYSGSFERAIEITTSIFQSAGKVIPSTITKCELSAIYSDGKKVCGESKIPQPGKRIEKVFFSKKNIFAYKKAIDAIGEADLILFGPGSLYTSIIPNLLIRGIKKAINESNAIKIYVCNCSTERGETENYSVEDHIKAIGKHTNPRLFEYCLVNDKILTKTKNVSLIGSVNNITTNQKEILGVKIYVADVVNNKNPLYHDSIKLAKAIIELYNKVKNNKLTR